MAFVPQIVSSMDLRQKAVKCYPSGFGTINSGNGTSTRDIYVYD